MHRWIRKYILVWLSTGFERSYSVMILPHIKTVSSGMMEDTGVLKGTIKFRQANRRSFWLCIWSDHVDSNWRNDRVVVISKPSLNWQLRPSHISEDNTGVTKVLILTLYEAVLEGIIPCLFNSLKINENLWNKLFQIQQKCVSKNTESNDRQELINCTVVTCFTKPDVKK